MWTRQDFVAGHMVLADRVIVESISNNYILKTK